MVHHIDCWNNNWGGKSQAGIARILGGANHRPNYRAGPTAGLCASGSFAARGDRDSFSVIGAVHDKTTPSIATDGPLDGRLSA